METASGQHPSAVARVVTAEGIGVHSGRGCRVTVAPSAAGRIRFFGPCGSGGPVESLGRSASERCTGLLLPGGSRVDMVEHLLAAFSILRIGSADIHVDGPELPILDGSALPWIRLLRKAGFRPSRQRHPLAVTRPFRFEAGGSRYAAWPGARSVKATVSYPGTPVGIQSASAEEPELEGLAPARTFAMESEVAAMRQAGLAAGGSLDNALVIGRAGPLNPGGFRFPDECPRHKALDLLGDLMLAGEPIEGRFEAFRPGHAANRAFLDALAEAGAVARRHGEAQAA